MRALGLALLIATAAPVFADPPAKADLYGDPLPAGAITRLGTIRNRAPITSFGIQEDGSVITVGPAGHLRRWPADRDAHEARIALPEVEHNGVGDRAQVSPDGRFVAARMKDKLVVWDVPASTKLKPKEVATFDVPGAKRFCFSPDGSALIAASGSYESQFRDGPHSAYLCALKTAKATKLEGTAVDFSQVAFSGDGKRAVALAATRQGNRFFCWNTANGKQLSDCKLEGRGCEACALNHKGDLLVAWVEINNEHVWHFLDPLTG